MNVYPGFILVAIAVVLRMLVKMIEDEEYVRGVTATTFNMVMLNGSAPHKHSITDFKMSGSPIKKGIATTYNGTATISLKKGSVSDVPISIKLIGPRAMSLWIDPSKTEGHFGDTPIYGVQYTKILIG
jgi:hypothetical protein